MYGKRKCKNIYIYLYGDDLLPTGLPCLVVILDHLLKPCCYLVLPLYIYKISFVNFFFLFRTH